MTNTTQCSGSDLINFSNEKMPGLWCLDQQSRCRSREIYSDKTKIGKAMKIIYLILACCWITSISMAQTPAQSHADVSFPDPSSMKSSEFAHKIIPAAGNSWGYELYVSGKLFIQQATIPGISGNTGFKTREQAERVARLITDKIRSGQMPPTVTPDDLKRLEIIY
jgi:hypothetical protein